MKSYCEYLTCIQLPRSCLNLCVNLTCSVLLHIWQVRHTLLIHLISKFAFPNPLPSSYTLIRTVDPSANSMQCQRSWLVQPFPSHSQFFLSPPWTLPAGLASAFIVSLKRWEVTCWSNLSAPNSRKVQDGAISYAYNKQHSNCIMLPGRLHRHTHMHTYPQDVHGCDQYAATLRWAFQHFWSGRLPEHSFPLSQYLHKHHFQG